MALFDTPLVALSMSEVLLSDKLEGSLACRRVYILLTEYAKDKYALVVCRLADGARFCDDPPQVLYSIKFPDEQLDLKFERKDLTVTVFLRPNWYFCLTFENSPDFWELVRIMAESYGVDAIREENIKELLTKAISLIPTVRDFPNADAMATDGQ